MKILVTGATGFIGSHLVPFLSSHQHEVATLNARTIGGDSTDWCAQVDACEVLVHLAGRAHVSSNSSDLDILRSLTTIEKVIVRKTVSSLSVYDFENVNSKIKIYPNPAKNQFILDYDAAIFQINKVQIINTLGELIFETNAISNNITFGEIQSGMYFVKIISDKFEITRKLIVK